MANPVIKLPAQFDGQTLSKVAGDVVARCKPQFLGGLIFDFAQLDFIRPAGITFLGRPYADARMIQLAYAYEQATAYRRAPPTL